MNDPEKTVDLAPQEWRSADSRQKPHEPFFGPGLTGFIAYISSFVVTATIVHYLWR